MLLFAEHVIAVLDFIKFPNKQIFTLSSLYERNSELPIFFKFIYVYIN